MEITFILSFKIFCGFFIIYAFIYSVLAAFTKLVYSQRLTTELNLLEIKILNGTANIFERIYVFIRWFPFCVFVLKLYVWTIVSTIISILVIWILF